MNIDRNFITYTRYLKVLNRQNAKLCLQYLSLLMTFKQTKRNLKSIQKRI